MKKILLLLLVVFFISAYPALSAAKSASKAPAVKAKAAAAGWAAKVNGDKITMDLYNKRLEAAIKQITKEISIEAAEEKGVLKETRKAVLEQMIEAVILLQWAGREGIEVKDASINAKIKEIKRSFPTVKDFYASLKEQGMDTNDLERNVRSQIAIEKLRTIREKSLAVTDEEIRDFYDKNIDLYLQPDKLYLKQIFSKELKDIENIKAGLDKNPEFKGEDIGLIKQGQLPVNDDSSLFLLKPGKISGIITGESGYYIFKIEKVLPGKEIKFADAKDNIRRFLLKEKARTQYLKDLQEEKANAKIILNEKLGILF